MNRLNSHAVCMFVSLPSFSISTWSVWMSWDLLILNNNEKNVSRAPDIYYDIRSSVASWNLSLSLKSIFSLACLVISPALLAASWNLVFAANWSLLSWEENKNIGLLPSDSGWARMWIKSSPYCLKMSRFCRIMKHTVNYFI